MKSYFNPVREVGLRLRIYVPDVPREDLYL